MPPTAFDVIAGEGADDLGFQFGAMASHCEVRIVGMSRRQAEPLAREAIAEVRRIESKFSRYREKSVVSRINALAGTGQRLGLAATQADDAHLALARHRAELETQVVGTRARDHVERGRWHR
jgi:hypothetical protein